MSPAAPPSATAPAMSPPATAAIISWYRGEFAAANAIIDALCSHMSASAAPPEYDAVFAAIHRRRLNWIPVLQMQKYFSIADVALELRKAVAAKKPDHEDQLKPEMVVVDEDSPHSDITDTGSQEAHATPEHTEICDNHEDCGARREQIKMTKGFVAKEPVKGHMVNVVKGLKMYDDIFTDAEMSKLKDYVNELRAAGQNGELLGDTYVLFNKQVKGSKREQVQLGVPIFGHIKEEAESEGTKTNIEPIPALLQSVIDHLVQWQILPQSRKPNGCVINYFDEGECSQPYLKPPHLDQPICTLLLSESTLAFGRTLVNDGEGNYKGNLMLTARQGCVLVMRNNSADMARNAMCPSPSKRASITFFRIRPNAVQSHIHNRATAQAPLTVWQPGLPSPCSMMIPNGYEPAMNIAPDWRLVQAPIMTVAAPMRPMVVNTRKMPLGGGTGVFLPWALKSRKPAKHLPPRALRNRLLALETMSDPGS